MPVKEIGSNAEFDDLIKSGKVVLVDFYAEWCGPCKIISPVFDGLSNVDSYPEGVEFCRVDVDALPDIAMQHDIRAMPTFHAYKDGVLIETLVGANRRALEMFVQNSLARM